MEAKLPEWIEMAAMILSSLVVVSTIVVRITPSKKDDDVHSRFAEMVMKVIKWLPTIGVNPQTKELERAYDELKKKNDSAT